MAHCCSTSLASIPEEILGPVREPSEDSLWCGQPTSRSSKIDLWKRARPTVATVEQPSSEVEAGRLLLCAVHYGRHSKGSSNRREET